MAKAKEKDSSLNRDRDLGVVKKRLPSGMYETSKGEKIPPLPNITIGTKIKLVSSKFEIVEDEKDKVVNPQDIKKNREAELEARILELEKQMGEKGSGQKASAVDGAGTDTQPPKVG